MAQAYKVTEVNYVTQVNPKMDLENVNTQGSEFGPVWHVNQLIFTSSREFDMLALGENNWKNSGYLNIYKSELKGKYLTDSSKFKKAELFSQQIQNGSHTGPACFSITGDTMFFTQTPEKIKKSKHKIYKPQLYMAVKDGKIWKDIQLLPFNNADFSFGHPSYNSKNQTLYFSSDMKGGKGGKDIYAVKLNNDGTWGQPQNLSHVNSEKNELFPFIYNHDLFFASDRDGGMGGLDLYWSNINPNATVQPLNSINSKFDDFSFCLIPGLDKGFMASNRNGSDDVFALTVKKEVIVTNELAGKFKYRNLEMDANGLKVILVDEDGNFSYETLTNSNGQFKFSNLDLNSNYTLKTKDAKDLELFIYDKEGNIVGKYLMDDKGDFTYRHLDYKGVNTLSLIPEDYKDFNLETGFLTAQLIYGSTPGIYPQNKQVLLVDENGQIKYKTQTDERGNFEFKNLSLNEGYLLTIPENEKDIVLLIYDKKGNVSAQLKGNEKGQFVYRKLDGNFTNGLQLKPENEEEFVLNTRTIAGNFNYRNLEGNFKNGLTVYIYNDAGILIATEKTNEKGQFRFRNLPMNDNFLFKIEENGELLSMDDFELFLEDRYGKKIAQLQRGENGYFIYKPLGLNIETNLTLKEEKDLEFELEGLSSEHEVKLVYFDSNKEKVKREDLDELDAIIEKLKANPKLKLEINAYADSRATDEYNLILSGKRGAWIKQYMINRGISKDRFIVNAYGESKLAVDCVECTEEQNAKNRRAELRLY
jgi:outer membrane protein OmpA-like peptidoglycan-associated protein